MPCLLSHDTGSLLLCMDINAGQSRRCGRTVLSGTCRWSCNQISMICNACTAVLFYCGCRQPLNEHVWQNKCGFLRTRMKILGRYYLGTCRTTLGTIVLHSLDLGTCRIAQSGCGVHAYCGFVSLHWADCVMVQVDVPLLKLCAGPSSTCTLC